MGAFISSPTSVADGTTITTTAGGAIQINTPSVCVWQKIEVLSPSAATTITSGTLTVYDEYMVVGWINGSNANSTFSMRINGDTGTNYDALWVNSTTNTLTSGANEAIIGAFATTQTTYFKSYIAGKSRAVASGKVGIFTNVCAASLYHGHSAAWTGGNATQVSTLTFKNDAAGTFTGTIEIYGRNRSV